MNLLILDTSSSFLQIRLVLSTGESLNFNYSKKNSLSNSHLASTLSFLISQAGLSLNDINLIIAPSGPGSFTGLRVGMSFVKGINCGLDIPIVFINLLDALAINNKGYTLSLIDGKKSRSFAGLYKDGEKISPYWDLSLEEISKEVRILLKGDLNHLRVYGNSALSFQEIEPTVTLGNNFLDTLSGLEVLGVNQYNKKGSDPVGSNLFYLRDSDAKASLKKV